MEAMTKSVLILLLSVIFLTGCAGTSDAKNIQGYALDTLVSITYYDERDEAAVQEALDLCKNYETVFSRTDSGSELYRLNECGSMEVSEDLLAVLTRALDWCRRSGSAFDITMGGVSSLYHFSGDAPAAVPDPGVLEEALSHVGWENIRVEGSTVTLADPEAKIDLGAIAKGYIADRMKDYLKEQGVKHAIISLGGNVLCLGGKPDGSPFAVGIRCPEKSSSRIVTALNSREGSVVTSGIYERFFEKDGVVYHHLLDSATGQPIRNGLRAVSICGLSSADCDALSTVCFALGETDGMALVESLDGVEALFLREDGTMLRSSGFADAEIKQ